ncbi:MAG: AAA family ATPase [Bacteroidales bacterium]|nr:AAA family ATPase [Bacteroidales bacterium]
MIGIIFIGAPCSGKSTIAKAVRNRLGIPYTSSGDIARHMAEHNSAIKDDLNNGKMAPEIQMRDKIYELINIYTKYNTSFVLDGFPRFTEQYEWLVNTFPNIRFICIYIKTSISTIYDRYSLRSRCDDTHGVFTQRVRYFINETMPLLNIMDNVHKVHNNDTSINELIDTVCINIEEELDADDSEVR